MKITLPSGLLADLFIKHDFIEYETYSEVDPNDWHRTWEKARYTYAKLTINNKEYEEYAYCNTVDNFNKETGRKLAVARCLKQVELSKIDRTEIWKNVIPKRF